MWYTFPPVQNSFCLGLQTRKQCQNRECKRNDRRHAQSIVLAKQRVGHSCEAYQLYESLSYCCQLAHHDEKHRQEKKKRLFHVLHFHREKNPLWCEGTPASSGHGAGTRSKGSTSSLSINEENEVYVGQGYVLSTSCPIGCFVQQRPQTTPQTGNRIFKFPTSIKDILHSNHHTNISHIHTKMIEIWAFPLSKRI